MSNLLTDTIDTDLTILPGSMNHSGAKATCVLPSVQSDLNPRPSDSSFDKHQILARRLQRSPHVMMWQHFWAKEIQSSCEGDAATEWHSDARMLYDLVKLGFNHRTWTPKLAGQVRSAVEKILPLLRSLVESTLTAESRRTYTETVILYSLMPLYVNVDQTQIAVGSEQTRQLLREALALFALDTLLDFDLVEILTDDHQYLTPPCDAIKNSFNYNLIEIAHFLARAKHDEAFPSSPLNPVPSPHRNGYWSLTLQWQNGGNHMTIPQELAVGHVAWSLAKNHWNDFFDALKHNVREKRGATKTLPPSSSQIGTSNTNGAAAVESANVVSKVLASAIQNLANQAMTTELASSCKSDINNCPTVAKTDACVNVDNLASDATLTKSIFTPNIADLTNSPEIIELRSANDPQLASRLDAQLARCRDTQGSLALVVVKLLKKQSSTATKQPSLPGVVPWQSSIIDALSELTDRRLVRGFTTGNGELALIFDDVDRNELTQYARESIDRIIKDAALKVQMTESTSLQLAGGIASVSSPSKSFKIDQLLQAAWRCLSAAESQGAGAVKSIEVF